MEAMGFRTVRAILVSKRAEPLERSPSGFEIAHPRDHVDDGLCGEAGHRG
jgi:hypothetical protein